MLVVRSENDTVVPIALGAAVWPDPGAQALCGYCRRRASLPLLELCLVTGPIQAEKSRPDRNVFGSATLATRSIASLPCSGGTARLIVPVYCGFRPKLKGPGEPAADLMTPAHPLTACNRTMARSNVVICLMATRSERPRPG